MFKGTVSIISSNPPCEDDVMTDSQLCPLKLRMIKYLYQSMFLFLTIYYFQFCVFSNKFTCAFLLEGNIYELSKL